jgi:POT family proton-dependent oligopeptide transporter
MREDGTGASAVDRSFFGHPGGLSTLFFTELWERFSFYGMRALLILFMTASVAEGGLGFDTARAGAIYGTYTALVYLTALPGGWLADRFLGLRHAVLAGGILILCGHVCLAIPSLATFYAGLAFIVAGTGLLKPNISALVGRLYADADGRRDAGFSIYYMGINLGAFFAPLVCGWLAQSEGWQSALTSLGIDPRTSWHFGFGAAAVGMLFGLVQYLRGGARLGDAGRPPERAATAGSGRPGRGVAIAVGACALAALLVGTGAVTPTVEAIAALTAWVLIATVVGFFAWLFVLGDWSPEERRRLVAIAVLFLGAAVFFSVFEQAGSTLNLFAERSTDTRVLGFAFPTSWFQSLNPILIIGLAPCFAWLWVRLAAREPSHPAKFAIGLACVAAGFALLIPAAELSASGVKVSPWWLVATYLLHTIGELCLSPVGLSAMTRLAPARVGGLMMGAWFLASSLGNFIGGQVASAYDAFSLPSVFLAVTLYALAGAVAIALLVRPIRRLLGTR